MKDVLFYYIRRNEKVKEFLAPFYKGYIYCKEYNRNKCYAIGAIKKLLEVDITQNVFGIFAYLHIVIWVIKLKHAVLKNIFENFSRIILFLNYQIMRLIFMKKKF